MTESTVIDVLITVPFSESLLEQLQGVSPYLNISVQPAESVSDIQIERWTRTEILYTDKVLPTPDIAKSLKWVQLHWSGAELLESSALISAAGQIMFTTLSGAVSSKVAEYALMGLLSLGQQLPIFQENKGKWPLEKEEPYAPIELRGSVVGIVGYGSIGREVARLLQPFGCTVLATKRDAKNPVDNGYCVEGQGDPDGDLFQRLYPAEALHSMLRECDLVVVAVPSTQSNHHLINEGALSVMKKTACLVNVSQRNIIDQTALLNALQEHRLAGVALDGFSGEDLPADHPLRSLPNVIITPNIAGESTLYHARAMDLFIKNCKRYIAGLPLYNLVDIEGGIDAWRVA
jgi:phosphoglycerate dehydrogenase-like enzyme